MRFKQRVAEYTTREEPIPWLDPSSPARPDEQERQIPVHLYFLLMDGPQEVDA